MQALRIHAGPRALEHVREHGLRPRDVRVIAAAAGGPKELILGHLDRHIFGAWLTGSEQIVHRVGVSVGAWRMDAGAMRDAATQLELSRTTARKIPRWN